MTDRRTRLYVFSDVPFDVESVLDAQEVYGLPAGAARLKAGDRVSFELCEAPDGLPPYARDVRLIEPG